MKMWFWVTLGIVISVLLPLIRALLPKPPAVLKSDHGWWEAVRPYVATAIFSFIMAALIVAAMGDRLNSWATALIAGYTWDSTLQKVMTGNTALNR
jgi:hypothetical protein